VSEEFHDFGEDPDPERVSYQEQKEGDLAAGPHDEGTRGPFGIPIETNEALPDNVIMVVPRRGTTAYVDELEAEVARLSALLDEERRKVERLEAWGNGESDALARAVAEDNLSAALYQRDEVCERLTLIEAERDAMRPVVEAAEAWRDQFTKPADMKPPRMGALIGAIDVYRSRSADPAGEQ
jgi:hypothetical protein